MADNKLNTQLQAILARLDRVDNDLAAQFSAQLLQAKSFASNPLTSAQGALMLSQFASRKAFTALADQLPGVETFKRLQQLDSAAMLEGLESRVASQAESMAQTVQDEISSAVQDQALALEQQATALVNQISSSKVLDLAEAALDDATQQLETAISEGASAAVIQGLEIAVGAADSALSQAGEQLDAAISALAGANTAVAQAAAFISKLDQTASAVTGFLDTLGGIAQGQTDSAIVRGTPPNISPAAQ